MMPSAEHSDSRDVEECISLSQSKYILAKYRIVIDDSEGLGPDISFEESPADEKVAHLHPGPKAIEPHLDGGVFKANKESLCRCLWCCCVPCYSTNMCWVKFCEMCYDDCSRYVTEKEEVSEMKFCTMSCCEI